MDPKERVHGRTGTRYGRTWGESRRGWKKRGEGGGGQNLLYRSLYEYSERTPIEVVWHTQLQIQCTMRWISRIGLFEMLIAPFAQTPADENHAIEAFRPQLRHVDAARTRGGEIVFSRRNRGVGRCDDEDEDDDQSMLFTQKTTRGKDSEILIGSTTPFAN